jgi:hypothetical protein
LFKVKAYDQMKVHVARDGEVIGEWTQTQLYKLLRTCEVFPSDYYWHEGMETWERLAQLPCGKSVLATPAQRRMLTDCDFPWDEFTTKYDVSRLMDFASMHTKTTFIHGRSWDLLPRAADYERSVRSH